MPISDAPRTSLVRDLYILILDADSLKDIKSLRASNQVIIPDGRIIKP